MISVQCKYCGTDFSAKRFSAKYCCDSCRTMACRRRRQAEAREFEQTKIELAAVKRERAILHQKTLLSEEELKLTEANRIEQEQIRLIDREAKRKIRAEKRTAENQQMELVLQKQKERILQLVNVVTVAIENKLSKRKG